MEMRIPFSVNFFSVKKFQPWIDFLFQHQQIEPWIGMPREEVVRRGIIRGEIPIYGTAGLAARLGRSTPAPHAK
jgi:hypothetical protein